MPLSIKGKVYPAPNEGNQPGITGSEIVAIEDHFGLDALILINTLSDDKPSQFPGYTKAKAMFAFCWICLTRGGEILSIQDVLNDYSIDDIVDMEIEDIKKEVISSSEVEQESE